MNSSFHVYIFIQAVTNLQMSQKRKIQATIGKMYGRTNLKTYNIQRNSETREETHNSHVEQLHEIFGSSFDHDVDEKTNEVEEEIANNSK